MVLPLHCPTSTLSRPLSSSFIRLSPPISYLFTPPAVLRFNHRSLSFPSVNASISTSETPTTAVSEGDKKVLLQVKDLRAKIVESDVQILNGVNLVVNEGEVCKFQLFLWLRYEM